MPERTREESIIVRKEVWDRWAAMKQVRQHEEPLWRDLREWIGPRRGRFDQSEYRRAKRIGSNMIDGTVRMALRTFAAGLHAGGSSPAFPWFRVVLEDQDRMEVAGVKHWCHVVTLRQRAMFARSNLYTTLPSLYEEEGQFGTAAAMMAEDPQDDMRFFPYTCGEYWISLGPTLRVDTIYKTLQMTVRQVVDAFGLDRCSSRVKSLYERSSYTEPIEVLWAIEPRSKRDPQRIDGLNKPWRSLWFEVNGEDHSLPLREGGYDEFPALVPRWDVISTDPYGYGPAMDAFGDARQLQTQQKEKAKALARQVNPPVQGPITLRGTVVQALPGGVTWYDPALAGAADGFRKLYDVDYPLQYLLADMQEVRERIKEAMYSDLFRTVIEADKRPGNDTAYQIAKMHEERLLGLGPALERQHGEIYSPLIDRSFAIGVRRGLFPPPPPEAEGERLKVEYVSVFATAQKLVGMEGQDRLLDRASRIMQLAPEAGRKMNWDQMLDEYADMLGTPPDVVYSDDVVAELRLEDERQRQIMEAAQQAQTMKTVGEGARAASQADTAPGSLLGDLVAAAGGGNAQ